MITVGPNIKFDPSKGTIQATGPITPNQAAKLGYELGEWAARKRRVTNKQAGKKGGRIRRAGNVQMGSVTSQTDPLPLKRHS